MIERHETDMDLETCISSLFGSSVVTMVFLCIKSLVIVVFENIIYSFLSS